MSDKKVKISNILGSQIPDFIQADNPLFIEFLKQYYESEEREYGNVYLSDHISSLKKISTVADISLVEKQTIPAPNSANPESPIVLSSLTYAYDDVINVNETTGFPDKYGLLKIDNEIITYTGKTDTSFTGCIRGFSGISAIKTANDPEFLTFSDTNASSHQVNTLVVNLSFLFVVEFYKKFKKQFLPGFEGKNFKYGLNVENILSRARDFYSSKGTDTSLKILFQVLYGENVEIIKPFNETLLPSDAEWNVTNDIIVESLSGNPINLIGHKIYQNSFTSPTASGAVSNAQEIFLKDKKYFKISFSQGTVTNKFNISTKTKVVSAASTTEVLTVDSTIGFNPSGNFYYPNVDNFYTLASYTSKSNNQFFGCTGITTTLLESDSIINENLIFGYENNDLTKICAMRVTGSVSGVSDATSTKYFDVDDLIRVKHLGEKVDNQDVKFNTWFYNNISYLDVINHDGSESFTTEVDHFLKKGDIIDIIFKSNGDVKSSNVVVKDANEPNKFSIEVTNAPNTVGDYIIRKKITFADNRFGITSLMGNIQNSFVDSDKNTYVSFSGYPSFETDTDNRSKTFSSTGVSTVGTAITVTNHNFLNGEQVYLNLGEDLTYSRGSGLTGITTGYYFVNVIDSNKIKLASTKANLFNQILEQSRYVGAANTIFNNVIHTITPADLYKREKLKNQNNFKRIYKNPLEPTNNKKLLNSVGISLNGVEYQSPISRDYVSYGQLDEIEVLNSGENYDVINPPTLVITDTTGSGCDGYGNFSGNLSEIVK